jgi:hypothetical protein
MTIEEFLAALQDWAKPRDPNFKYYWPVKGGWEGWIQVDLTAFIIDRLATVEILREQPIYQNGRQLVDLLINTNEPPGKQIAIEIKAQSFENRTRFITGVVADLNKFETVDTAYQDTPAIMVAIPFNQATLDEVIGLERDDHPVFASIYLGEIAIAVAVWTAERGWINPGVPQQQAAAQPAGQPEHGVPTTGFSAAAGTDSDSSSSGLFPTLTSAPAAADQMAGR